MTTHTLNDCPAVAVANGATVLRVPVVPQPPAAWCLPPVWIDEDGYWNSGVGSVLGTRSDLKVPYKPGDVLRFREEWLDLWPAGSRPEIERKNLGQYICYREGFDSDMIGESEWRPAATMPEWAIRLVFKVTGVRVEGLSQAGERTLVEEFGIDNGHAAMFQVWAMEQHWNSRRTPEGDLFGDTPGLRFEDDPMTYVYGIEKVSD